MRDRNRELIQPRCRRHCTSHHLLLETQPNTLMRCPAGTTAMIVYRTPGPARMFTEAVVTALTAALACAESNVAAARNTRTKMRGNSFNFSTPYKNSICQHASHNGRVSALIKIKGEQARSFQADYLSNDGTIRMSTDQFDRSE